ncbi:MAG: oxidoreductase [unclassified Hahellaceae]|nr:oxidoreductase [Hahellaceae bacterium]|tara:strand:- start:15532 stop:16296 length:765 start_codon:yes stop_codon:yes gene_type:complete
MAISLGSISKTQRAVQPPRIVVHGEHGVGKTTLGATANRPVFLPLEDGLTGLEVDAFPQLTSWDEVKAAITALTTEEHKFGTAVIDSLDWLEPLIWDAVSKAHGKSSIEEFGYGKGYVEAVSYWREFLDACDKLRASGMAVILIAHSEIKRFDSPDTDAYDRYQIKLHRMASAVVQEWADVIGFAQFETTVKKQDTGFGSVKTRGMSTGRRLLHVVEKPAFVAKNRYSLPDSIPLSWDALVNAIQNPTTSNQAA